MLLNLYYRLEHWFWDQVACLVVRYGKPWNGRDHWVQWGRLWLQDGENSAALYWDGGYAAWHTLYTF